MNYSPVLFRDRPRPVQIVLGGVIPFALGALQGVLIGVSPLAGSSQASSIATGGAEPTAASSAGCSTASGCW
jgi:hypothetical protein